MQTFQIRLTKELIKKAKRLVDKGLYSNKSEVVRDSLRRLVFDKRIILRKEKEFIIIFTSDLHGNLTQYKKLFKKAYEDKVDAIILGGDLTPKDSQNRTIKKQIFFLEKKLFPIIKQFNDQNKKRSKDCETYIIMGNDDFKANHSILKRYEKGVGFKLIHNKCIKLHESFKIIGYSFVPLTPFIYKDWEKLDLNKKDERTTRKDFLMKGKRTKGNNFIEVKFNLKERKNTIEKDLLRLTKCSDPKKTVLVSHAPPQNTNLDMPNYNEHVGSAAIKEMIKEKQPYLTLHGHIHQTVDISGSFMNIIKETISISSGNDHQSDRLAIIKLNLYKPIKAKREII